jgi:hypothetical protein
MLDPDLAHLSNSAYSDMEKGNVMNPMHRFRAVGKSRSRFDMYKQGRKGKLWLAFDITIISLIIGLIVLAVMLAKSD